MTAGPCGPSPLSSFLKSSNPTKENSSGSPLAPETELDGGLNNFSGEMSARLNGVGEWLRMVVESRVEALRTRSLGGAVIAAEAALESASWRETSPAFCGTIAGWSAGRMET